MGMGCGGGLCLSFNSVYELNGAVDVVAATACMHAAAATLTHAMMPAEAALGTGPPAFVPHALTKPSHRTSCAPPSCILS